MNGSSNDCREHSHESGAEPKAAGVRTAEHPIKAVPSPLAIGFAFALSLPTGIVFGVAPAWIAAQARPADALRSRSRNVPRGASLLRGLVVVQASLSLVLLVGAGLFAQRINKLETSEMHLDLKNRYNIHINPQAAGYATTQVESLYRTIEAQFHGIPGIVKLGIATHTPMEDNNWSNSIRVPGGLLIKNAGSRVLTLAFHRCKTPRTIPARLAQVFSVAEERKNPSA